MDVTISDYEVMREPKPWPGATYENVLAVVMMRRGLRLRPSVSPMPKDLLPPWRVTKDRASGAIAIWQGDTTTKD